MSSGYTSDELSHFVGFEDPIDHESNYQRLLTVLTSGWVSHAPHEQNWGKTSYTYNPDKNLASGKRIDPTVTCYCDIPSDKLALHVTKYGLFGLSFWRAHLVKYGARPVIYFPMSATDQGSINGQVLMHHIESIHRSFRKYLVDPLDIAEKTSGGSGQVCSTPEETIRALESVLEKDFLAFIKPFNADSPIETFENYYLEREWRKYGNMMISNDTVSAIFVAADFLDRFKQDRPDFASLAKALPMDLCHAKTRCFKCHKPLPTDRRQDCPHCGTAQKLHTEPVESWGAAADSLEGIVTRKNDLGT